MIYETNKNLSKNYKRLINLAPEYCKYFSLIIREEDTFPISLYDKLSPFLFRSQDTNKWPGTILSNKKAKQYIFQLDKNTVKILLNKAEDFWSWVGPDLPEDLTFLRKDLSPWFVTISHEKDSYFDLNHSEFNKIKNKIPEIFNININKSVS